MIELTDEQKAQIDPLQRLLQSEGWRIVEEYMLRRSTMLDKIARTAGQDAGYRLESMGRRDELLTLLAHVQHSAGEMAAEGPRERYQRQQADNAATQRLDIPKKHIKRSLPRTNEGRAW